MNVLVAAVTLAVHYTNAEVSKYQVRAMPICRNARIFASYISTEEDSTRPVNCPKCRALAAAAADSQVQAWTDRHAALGTDTSRQAYATIAYRMADEVKAYEMDAARTHGMKCPAAPRLADRKVRKNLYAAFVDSLDFPTLEDYGFERAVAADIETRKERAPKDLILSV
jgi:hypothetical protein